MYPSFPRTLHVLLVERDRPRGARIRQLLQEVRVQVLEADDLDAAVALLRRDDHVEAVLVDVGLLTESVGAALDRLRAAGPTVAVVVLGHDEQEESAREAVRAGARGYVLDSQLQQGAVYRILARAVVQSQTQADLELAEGALLECESRYRSLYDLCPEAICTVDTHGIVTDANRAALGLFGRDDHELLGYGLDTLLVRDEDREGLRLALRERRTPDQMEVPIRGTGGAPCWVTLTVSPRDSAGGEARGCYVFLQSMADAGIPLARGGFLDPLTGMPNRSLLLDRLNHVLSRRKRREGRLFAVLFVDLDRFKQVNDHFGHEAGDDLLRQAAARLVDSVREEDTVARLGGDEFVVVLPEIEAVEDATIIADRMLAQLGRVFVLGGDDVRISCSIGITLGSDATAPADEILRQADFAMYQAKALGPGRYRIYDRDMQERVTRTLAFDAELRRALLRKEFVVHYQPVVDAGSGRVAGFEALVRWRHPERGLLQPADFIPVAQERGFMEEIGSWVLGEVCRQLREWHERYPDSEALEVSVNLSAPEFMRLDFVDEVRRAIDQHGIPPGVLRLELGERALSADPDLTVATLERLKGMGIRVAIDDFGRGVYSWSYLGSTPVDSLKIPRDLLAATGEAPGNGMRRLAAVTQCLGLHAVAEGVETQDQLTACRAAGSDYAQGFLFWRPLEADEAATLLAGEDPGD